MIQDKKKVSGARDSAKNGSPPGLVIVLALAGGVVIGSAGTYFLSRPAPAPAPSNAPAASGTPPAPTVTIPSQVPPQGQYTPAPQPPGEVPPGKVWSVEHGHWHDAPVALTTPVPAPPAPTPAAVPAEKK